MKKLLSLALMTVFFAACSDYLDEFKDEYEDSFVSVDNPENISSDSHGQTPSDGSKLSSAQTDASSSDAETGASSSSKKDDEHYDCYMNDSACISKIANEFGKTVRLLDSRNNNVYTAIYVGGLDFETANGYGSIFDDSVSFLLMTENLEYEGESVTALDTNGVFFYTYENAEKACPTGWRLPKITPEWFFLLTGEGHQFNIELPDDEKGCYTNGKFNSDKSIFYWAQKEGETSWFVKKGSLANDYDLREYERCNTFPVRCVKEFGKYADYAGSSSSSGETKSSSSEGGSSSAKSSSSVNPVSSANVPVSSQAVVVSSSSVTISSSSSSSSNKPCEGDGWNVLYEEGGESNMLIEESYDNNVAGTYKYYFFVDEQGYVLPVDMSKAEYLCVVYGKTGMNSIKPNFQMGYYDKNDGSPLWYFAKEFDLSSSSAQWRLNGFGGCHYDNENDCKGDGLERKINAFSASGNIDVKKIAYKRSNAAVPISKYSINLGIEGLEGSFGSDFKDRVVFVADSYERCYTDGSSVSDCYLSNKDYFIPSEISFHNDMELTLESGVLVAAGQHYTQDYLDIKLVDEMDVYSLDFSNAKDLCLDVMALGPFTIELRGGDLIEITGEVGYGNSLGTSTDQFSIFKGSSVCVNVANTFKPISNVTNIILHFTDPHDLGILYIKSIYTTGTVTPNTPSL